MPDTRCLSPSSPIPAGAWTVLLCCAFGLSPLTLALPFEFWTALQSLQAIVAGIVVGYLASAVRPQVSIGVALVALSVELVTAAVFAPPGVRDDNFMLRGIPIMIVLWLVGNTIRIVRQYRLSRQTQAAQAERLRIARELHDILAHSIGVIAIQAGMGSRIIATQPDDAASALRAIEDVSRDTLAGLRRMIGALRRSDGEPILGEDGLACLDDLVARSAGAGLRVDVRWAGQRCPLPPDIDLSAFRIIQEAVTNVVRHAGTDRCEVALDQRDQDLFINVTDNGRGGVPTAGYGLRGMCERVAILQGECTAEPGAHGGFRVAVRIPIPAGLR